MRRIFGDEEGEVAHWLDRAKRGDARAWDRLVDRFQNLVYSVARRNRLDANDASDVFQATFLALYRNLDRIEQAATLGKWLAVTAARESIRLKRQQSRVVHEDGDGPGLDEILADEDASVEVQAVAGIEAEYWRRAVISLGGRCEQLLSALYFDDKSYEEIVSELGIPIGAIGPTRARCLEKLRKVYQNERKETLD